RYVDLPVSTRPGLLDSRHFISLILLTSSCVLLSPQRSIGPSEDARPVSLADTSLFAAVLRSIPALQVTGNLEVDPHPRAAGEHVGYPSTEFRAPSDSAELATRHEILKQLGISITTDASAGSCHGVLAP